MEMLINLLNLFSILLMTLAATTARSTGDDNGNLIIDILQKNEKKPLLGGWSSPYQQGNCLNQLSAEKASFDPYSHCAIANKTIKEMYKNKNSVTKLIDVCDPKQQLVNGMNYEFKALLEEDGVVKSCETKVYESFQNELDVQKFDCTNAEGATGCQSLPTSRKRRSLLGGEETIDIGQDDTQQAAQWAVEHINSASNGLFMHSLQKVLRVTRQVVNGFRYRISLTTAQTTCRNSRENYGKSLEICPVTESAMTQKCKVSVIYSLGKYSMEDYNCVPFKKILGGDDHDYSDHGRTKIVLGGDDHDYKPHSSILGRDGHGQQIFGGGDHDYKPHSSILGRDGHGQQIFGGDDHDMKDHRINHKLLGGDDHDKKDHGINHILLGGDDHDKKDHGIKSNLLGGDSHDYVSHNVMRGMMGRFGMPDNQEKFTSGSGNVQKMAILGGDDHGYQPHQSHCLQYKDEFEQFKVTHQRFYGDLKEETQRFQVFCENMGKMKKIQEMEKGTAKYGVTKFSDLTEEEFQKQYLGLKPSSNMRQLPKAKIPTGPVPDSWDWRDHGAVTPVKNQGSCGSCWAFSTTGNVEGQWAINKKKLLSLSEQELVDCDKVDEGCNGGLPSQAYDAIMKLGGLETENDYKYEGRDEKCQFNKTEAIVKVTGAVNISQDETEMAAWLYHNGPISIGINAFGMQFYWGGIAHPWKIFCNPKSLDHGVLIVGFGEENNKPYWIVKNSWGPSWGREGYYYVYRGDGTCGLNTMCTSATVE